MELTFGTGFICPECGREATYKTGFWGMVGKAPLMERVLDRLNREGGTMKSDACPHEFPVRPGSRKRQ